MEFVWNLFQSALLVAFALAPIAARSSQATVEWTASPETNVAFYVLYYGNASGNYPNRTNVGNVVSATLVGLADGVVWYLAVTAMTEEGAESDFSNEATYFGHIDGSNTPPRISAIPDQIIHGREILSIPFTISDDHTPSEALVITTTSSNRSLISSDDIVFDGEGSDRNLRLKAGVQIFGITSITLSLSDGVFTNSTVFRVTVIPVVDLTPTIEIARFSDQVILSWPIWFSDWILETRADLSSTGAWTMVPDSPELIGDKNIVPLAGGDPVAFFRLKKISSAQPGN